MDPVNRFVAVATRRRFGRWRVEVRDGDEVIETATALGGRNGAREVAQSMVNEAVMRARGTLDRIEVRPTGWTPPPPPPPDAAPVGRKVRP